MRILFLILLLFVTGCAPNFDNLRDERYTKGCVVVSGSYVGSFAQGNAQACKVLCTDDLPSGYVYQYNSGGCNVAVGE